MILALKTDAPEAELYLYGDGGRIEKIAWQAHRELSSTILSKVDDLLASRKLYLKDLTGLIVYRGPGSFTGLRIGISVMNTLSYSLELPLVGVTGTDWIESGLQQLLETPISPGIVIPEYGGEAHITKPRK